MAGQAITKKSSKQKGGRQTKLTSMLSSQKSATMPSAYGEVIEPVVPEFQEKVVKKVRPKKTAEEKEKSEYSLLYHMYTTHTYLLLF